MGRQPQSWKQKVHPAFEEIAALRRARMQAQQKPRSQRAEAVRKVVRAAVEKRYELLNRYPELSPGFSWGPVRTAGYQYPSGEEKLLSVFEWVFFKRFRVPFRMALERENQGDLEAHDQIIRATDEFWRLQHGHPIVPFKVDEIHSDLIELDLNLGLGNLTSEELADCFDALCPCGNVHDADAMKKQRRRVKENMQIAFESNWHLTPPRERFAVFGDRGYVARPYHPNDGAPYIEISRRGRGLEYIIRGSTIWGYKSDSEFRSPEVLFCLPKMFFVLSIDDLFTMFFPGIGA